MSHTASCYWHQGMKEKLSFHALSTSLWPGNFYRSQPLYVSSGSDCSGTIFIHLTATEMVCLRPPQETLCRFTCHFRINRGAYFKPSLECCTNAHNESRGLATSAVQNNRAISFDDRTIITTIIDNYNSQEELLLAKLFFSAFNLTFPHLYN